MGILGDYFSEDLKEEFSKRSIKVGSVLRLKVADTTPPKIKIFIIVGQTIEGFSLATLYVNSNINFRVNLTQELVDLQVPLSKEDYGFLDHDSYVDCSKLMIKDRSELEKLLSNRPDALVDELSHDQVERLIFVIKKSDTIKGKIKKRFGLYD